MSPGAVIGLIVVVILAIVFQIILTNTEEAVKNRTPTPISHLRSMIELSGKSMWLVTITRRSGYDHLAWSVPGSRENALDLALEKLRHARIDVVEVICNRPDKFEVKSFYDSRGARRTGKYIGGFTIIPQKY